MQALNCPSKLRNLWPAHLAAAALFVLVPCTLFASWLVPYHLPQRGGPQQPFRAGDLTPLFYVWNTVTHRMVVGNGELPLWTDHIYCGEPFLAKAQVGVFSLTTALLFLLPPELVSTWTFLLHLALAGLATYGAVLWLLRASVDRRAAWIAATSAGLFYQTSAILIEHTIQGHGPIVVAACFTPLILTAAIEAVRRGAPLSPAAALAGLLIGVQFLAGGATATLYSGLAVALVTGGHAVRVGSWASTWLSACAGLAIAMTAAGIAAVKLFPAWSLMEVSNRAGGLDPWVAAAPIIEFPTPLVAWPLDPTGVARQGCWLVAPLALAALGLGQRAVPLRTRLILALIAAVGLIVATRPEAFVALWYGFPGFRYQRIPQRALMLFYAAVALLLGLGLAWLVNRYAWWKRHGLRTATAAVVAFGAACGENLAWRSELPPVRDIRVEQQANALWNHVADQGDAGRVHVIESRDRNWGIEHITTPLGLETMVGWDHMWLLDYLGAEGRRGRAIPPFVEASYRARHPEKFWALAGVRWVSSSRPELSLHGPDWRGLTVRREPRLVFRGRFPESPYAQPAWSDGPYLFENPLAQPKAWFARHAIAVIGPKPARRLAVYRMIDELPFRPGAYVIIEFDSQRASVAANLPNVAAVFSVGPRPVPGLRHWDPYGEAIPAWLKQLATDLDEPPSPPPVKYRRVANHTRTLELPEHPPGYIVLAEKFAHFPGWTAEEDHGQARSLLAANGVFSAVPVPGRGRVLITLRYRPPGFRAGLGISLCTLILVTAVVGTHFFLACTWRPRR